MLPYIDIREHYPKIALLVLSSLLQAFEYGANATGTSIDERQDVHLLKFYKMLMAASQAHLVVPPLISFSGSLETHT